LQSVDAYIGIGSNLGEKQANCQRAIEMLGHLADTELKAVSRFYKTEPVGVEDEQDWYLNAVIREGEEKEMGFQDYRPGYPFFWRSCDK